MRFLSILEAVREAMHTALGSDRRVLLLGQDIGRNGGVFRATDGLFEEFRGRVIDMPISEAATVGAAVGLAVSGLVPIVELQFLPFAHQAFHQLVDQLPRMRNRSQGRFNMSVTVRAPFGGGVRAPELHSDAVEAHLTNVPGLKVLAPATARDAKGLLLGAIRDPDPVVFLEPLASYHTVRDDVPMADYATPFVSRLAREGADVALVGWSSAVHLCIRAAERAESEGISCAVLDLRSLVPLDVSGLTEIASRTGRVIVVHEAPVHGGYGAEVAATIQDEVFTRLKTGVRRVGALNAPYPFYSGERLFLPGEDVVLQVIREIVRA